MEKKRVLVVEDDVRAALVIKNSLADLATGMEVETAASGEEALERIERDAWNLVVTDHRMSGITGLELIQALKEKSPSTLTILVTAFGSDEIEQAAERLNVYHYLLKPFTLDDLERVIKDALGLDGAEPTPPPDREDRLTVKVTLAGDGGVGKTTLIHRYCTGSFDPSRRMTIGVDFHLYDLQDYPSAARLIVWDVSGQARFAFTRRAFYRGSKAVGLVYAINDRGSFAQLIQWRDEIREILPKTPLILVGNKIDSERRVTPEEGQSLAAAWGVPFFETSCMSGDGVQDFFVALTEEAIRYVTG